VPAEGRITSLRKVDWGSMRVNFFVMFPRCDARGAGHLHQRLPRAGHAGLRQRAGAPSRTSPTWTSRQSIAQVQRVLDQVIRAVEFLFGFTLLAGLVVLFAAVTATREARAREFAIMRAVGASSRLLAQVQRAELLGVGALAGVLASLVAVAVGWALARYAFEVQLERLRPGCRWPALPGRRACWRWPPAGGACARCCAGR
jgi:putative ABC transport system permease protein